jgi:ATP-dependent DNA helicase DinG
MIATEILGPGGRLAHTLPDYEDRREQQAMANAVARALDIGRPLIVEAGTGTGKTLAYLVPALLSGKRVVVSTGTRALQDQIARHDVPLLRAMLARPFEAVVVKGVANYACRRRLLELQRRRPGDATVAALVDWADETVTGDRAEVEWLGEDAAVWTEATTTPDARVGSRCPHFDRCFVTRARNAAESAQLVLVNHSLYLSDRALRRAGARILPDHDAVIFDEAHQLGDIATEHFGARVSTARLAQLIHDGRVAFAGASDEASTLGHDAAATVERAAASLFATIRTIIAIGERVPLPEGVFHHEGRRDAWFALDSALEELACHADSGSEPGPDDAAEAVHGSRVALSGLARRAREIRDDLAMIAEQHGPGRVYWAELRAASTTLASTPVDVAALLRTHVITAGPTPIFTSATLATTGADFRYARTRLGLDEADELALASPFDYARQALLYVPRDLPEPAHDTFSASVATRMLELLELTEGRAFLLFTSRRALRDASNLLTEMPYPRLVQGDAPKATLIDRFRSTPNAVLLGTSSFWEGVDVPGDALSLVVIDKLPFEPPTDPLVAARAKMCAETGADPFDTLHLPQAAIALKQGFGRLIRRRDDRGIVAILDGRIVTRGYGRTLLAALPADLQRTSVLEQVRRWWRDHHVAETSSTR